MRSGEKRYFCKKTRMDHQLTRNVAYFPHFGGYAAAVSKGSPESRQFLSSRHNLQTRLLVPRIRSGIIPPELGQLCSLEVLDLSWNKLYGRWTSGAGRRQKNMHLRWAIPHRNLCFRGFQALRKKCGNPH